MKTLFTFAMTAATSVVFTFSGSLAQAQGTGQSDITAFEGGNGVIPYTISPDTGVGSNQTDSVGLLSDYLSSPGMICTTPAGTTAFIDSRSRCSTCGDRKQREACFRFFE